MDEAWEATPELRYKVKHNFARKLQQKWQRHETLDEYKQRTGYKESDGGIMIPVSIHYQTLYEWRDVPTAPDDSALCQ